jgi:hypothetical protein
MAYTSMLLGLSIRAQGRGYPAWKTAVRDGILLYPAEKAVASPAEVPAVPVTVPQSQPLAPLQTLPNSTSRSFPGISQV